MSYTGLSEFSDSDSITGKGNVAGFTPLRNRLNIKKKDSIQMNDLTKLK